MPVSRFATRGCRWTGANSLREWTPPGIALCLAPIRSQERPSQFPAEEGAIAQASAKRRNEFLGGRECARTALSAFGLPPRPLPSAPDRTVIWPRGYVGSISHSDKYCIAAAARESQFLNVGIDLEPSEPVDTALIASIVNKSDTPSSIRDGLLAKRMFVAKEAFYKAYYRFSGVILDFQEVRIEFTDSHFRRFKACLVDRSEWRLLDREHLDGVLVEGMAHFFGIVALHRPDATA